MPLGSVEAMNASLDNDYGLTRGPHAPAAHGLALFVGDPMTDGVELDPGTNPGYARANVPASKWLDADAGFKSTDGAVQFAAPTAAWADEATHCATFDGSIMWDAVPLIAPLAVTSASAVGPTTVVTIFYDDAVSPV